MMHLLPAFGALLLGVFLLLVGSGLLSTLLGLKAVIGGVPTPVIGVIMAAFYAGLILGSIYCRAIIARVGHIRAFSAFVSIVSAVPLLHGFFLEPALWIVLRIITGFCFAGIYTVTESWLNARVTGETRGRVFSIYMITTYLALGTGQFLLTLDDPAEIELLAVVTVLVSLAIVPVALTRSAAPEIEPAGRLDLLGLYRMSPLGLAGSFGAGLTTGAMYGMLPVFGQGIGMDVPAISALMSSMIIGGLLVQWPIGRLSDIRDRRKIMTGCAIVASFVALFVFLWTSMPQSLMIAAVGIFGGLALCLYSLAVAHTNDMSEGKNLVETSAGLVLVWGAGAVLGPLVGGGVMSTGGNWWLFLYLSAVMALLALFALFRMTRRPAKPLDEQAPYVAMARTSPELAQLDPRAEDND